jgi:hypothetical protein
VITIPQRTKPCNRHANSSMAVQRAVSTDWRPVLAYFRCCILVAVFGLTGVVCHSVEPHTSKPNAGSMLSLYHHKLVLRSNARELAEAQGNQLNDKETLLPRRFIVRTVSAAGKRAVQRALQSTGASSGIGLNPVHEYTHVFHGFSTHLTLDILQHLLDHSDVESIEEDGVVSAGMLLLLPGARAAVCLYRTIRLGTLIVWTKCRCRCQPATRTV